MMLETLKCTTDILDEYKIRYFIDTGTLLGSIRHGGFISPDDREDVDIGMCMWFHAMPWHRRYCTLALAFLDNFTPSNKSPWLLHTCPHKPPSHSPPLWTLLLLSVQVSCVRTKRVCSRFDT